MNSSTGIKWLLGLTAFCCASLFSVVASFADPIVSSGQIAIKRATVNASTQEMRLLLPQLLQAKSRLPTLPFDADAFRNTISSYPVPEGTPGVSGSTNRDTRAIGTGSTIWPYSTARVANSSSQPVSGIKNTPVTGLPYRATGKLYVRFGTNWIVCTASLIRKSILITAAHCVHEFGRGTEGFADQVLWAPANTGGVANPGFWGFYEATSWLVPMPYFHGTDTCTTRGIMCNNDIAIAVLLPKNGTYAGDELGGWYQYGWGGYSFDKSPAFGKSTLASITQLGYPLTFDGGLQMQRNDSFGIYVADRGTNKKKFQNILLGSPMLGGSSGGPWLVNFGTEPNLTSPATMGKDSVRNVVVGVSSYALLEGTNIMGSSWFGKNAEFPDDNGVYGAGNIGHLMSTTCTQYPAYC